MPLPLIDRISDSELKLVYRWLMNNGFEHCQICWTSEDLTFDHIIPKIRGGSNSWDNLCIMCGPCNVAKGSKIIQGLVPLSSQAPKLTTVQIYDLQPGMRTFFGVIEATGFVGHFNNKDMYVIEFSGENLLRSVMNTKQLRHSLANSNCQSRPGDQQIPLDPRFCLV